MAIIEIGEGVEVKRPYPERAYPQGLEPGMAVIICDSPWYHGFTHNPRRAHKSLAGAIAVVLPGGPDADGDVPIKILDKFYEEFLAPECLTPIKHLDTNDPAFDRERVR